MMQGYATVKMAGNLTKNPELRYRPSDGEPVALFCLAVPREVKSAFHANKWVDYIECKKIGDGAEEFVMEFEKGAFVNLEGYLRQERYKVSNGERSRLIVEAVTVERAEAMACT